MAVTPPSLPADDRSSTARPHRGASRLGLRARLRGGPEGNEQLTAVTGAVLVILLAVLGITIIRIGQLIWLHLFLGLLLIGPVLLKMASTGYRFALYYIRDRTYRLKGPPEMWLRLLAPVVVLTTIGVFATGVALLFVGPAHREPLGQIHKITFIVWGVFTGLHVLGHLPAMPAALRGGLRGPGARVTSRGDGRSGPTGLGDGRSGLPGLDDGRGARAITLAGALVAGLVIAIVLIPDFATWTAHPALWHHHHHGA